MAALEARRMLVVLCAELRSARIGAGLSLDDAARAAGISPSQLGRLERGLLSQPTVEQLCRAGAPVGLRASMKLYEAGAPIRDPAQLALLGRFEAALGPPLRLVREVPLPIERDLRAWDGMVVAPDSRAFVEGETHLTDVQAFERRLRLKLRDDERSSTLILLLMRSAHHRDLLRLHRETLRDLLPLDGAAILRALRSGHTPPTSGILMF